MVKKLGLFLLNSDRNAGLIALLFNLLSLINIPGGFIAGIIVGFVTLQKGAKSGLIILAWVALPTLSQGVLGQFGLFDLLLVRAILIWCLALILRKQNSWGLVLECTALLGCLIVLMAHLWFSHIEAWWIKTLNEYYHLFGKDLWTLSETQVSQIIHTLAPYATGVIVSLVLLGTVVQVLIARGWQSVLFNFGGFKKEFISIRMGKIAAIVMLVTLIGGLCKMAWLRDIMVVFWLPFVLGGLAFLHYWVNKHKKWMSVLIAFYVISVFLPVFSIIVLVMVGFMDSWFNFRKMKFISR